MTPLIFSQPQVPPSKEFAKKNQGPPWISNYCASMIYDKNDETHFLKIKKKNLGSS